MTAGSGSGIGAGRIAARASVAIIDKAHLTHIRRPAVVLSNKE
jgi:hypothetical protein